MKIEDIKRNFPDLELQHAITGGLIEDPATVDVSENAFIVNLLASQKREAVAELFFKTIAEKYRESPKEWQKRLLLQKVPPVIKEKGSALSEKVLRACLEHWKPFASEINRELNTRGMEPLYKIDQPAAPLFAEGFQFARFADEECRLVDLMAKRDALAENGLQMAKTLLEEIDRRDKNDPAHCKQTCIIATRHQNQAPQPLDKNYLGKEVGLFCNASLAKCDKESLILSALPIRIEDAANYFEAALAHNTKLFVSLHEPEELSPGTRQSEFWKNETLSRVRLRNGVTLQNMGDSTVVAKGTFSKLRPTMLVASSIMDSMEKTVRHLHCAGWPDGETYPDEELLLKLVKLMKELSPDPKFPIAINCKGGVGRTGTLALLYLVIERIRAQLEQRIPLQEIRINIPELLYALRGERSELVSRPQQLLQVYSVAALHAAELLK